MAEFETTARPAVRQAGAYLGAPIGDFYAIASDRLMLYPFMAVIFLLECLVYWVIRHGADFMLDHMAFTTIYSLHKAALFTTCLLMTDMLANRFAPSWGAYKNRTVGRQWVIWTAGLFIGLLLLKTFVNRFIVLYAPEVIFYFVANPELRPSLFKILTILLPLWGFAVFLSLQVAISKTKMKRLAGEIAVTLEASRQSHNSVAGIEGKHPSGMLKLGPENENRVINLADITHVTVEDHYCRVNYSTGNGLKNVMLRLPLKEMMLKLPPEHFLQIHRSHVINLGRISRLTRDGREHKVALAGFDVELPVSRHRFKQLEPRLKAAMSLNP